MGTTKFFFPSTAYRGRNPRLRIPTTDPGLSDKGWIPGAISTGTELQYFLQVIEPLLTAVYVAGYAVPQITVLSVSGTQYQGGLQYDTQSSRVLLLEKQAAEDEFGQLANSPCVYLKMVPIWAQGPTGVVNRAAELSIDGVSPGVTESSMCVQAGTGSGFRDRFHSPVVDLTNKILPKLNAGTGLLGIYDYSTWNINLLEDLQLAVYKIGTYFLPQATVDSLRMDLGNLEPDGPASTLRLYRYLTSTDRLHNRERERNHENLVGETEALQSKLSATLALSGLEADFFGDVPYTMLLLELYSRGVIDILKEVDGPGGITDNQVAAILAKPSPLQAADIQTLCAYLSSGTGAHINNTSARLALEYPLTSDNVLRGSMVQAVIDICAHAAAVPLTEEQPTITPGSFEFHLAQLVAFTNCEVNEANNDRISEFTQDLWQRWQSGLGNADTAEKFHYGAGNLFLEAADYEIEFAALKELVTYYVTTVAHASQDKWRFNNELSLQFTPPVGWSDSLLEDLIQCYLTLPAGFPSGEMNAIYSNLERLVGKGIFHIVGYTMAQVDEKYAQLFQEAFDSSANGSALSDYGFLTMAIMHRYNDDDFAARFRLNAATEALYEMVASNREGIADTLSNLRKRAAEEAVGVSTSFNYSVYQKEWFTSPATQYFLSSLDGEKRAAFERAELEILELTHPEAAAECLQLSAAYALIAGSDQYIAEQTLEVVESGILQIWEEIGLESGVNDARNSAKFLKDGLKASIHKPFIDPATKVTYRDVAKTIYLVESGKLDDMTVAQYIQLRKAWSAADELEFRVGSNLAAVLAAFLALKQMQDVGIPTDTKAILSTVGLLRDAATGVQAGTELSISLISSVMKGYTGLEDWSVQLERLMTSTSSFGKYLSTTSYLISFVSNGYSARLAFEAGDTRTGILLGLAAVTNYFCFTGTVWTMVFGFTPLFSVVPIVAAVGAGLVLAAALWPIVESYIHQNQFNSALVRNQAIWDETVALALPVGVDVVRDLERIDLADVVHSYEPLIEVVTPADWDYFELPWSPNTAKLQIFSDLQQSYLSSPIPGDPEWRGSYRNADHYDIGENILSVHPLLEYTVRADSAGVVVVNMCSPGEIVDRNAAVIEVEMGETRIPCFAIHGGMILDALPAGSGFSANDVICRLRLDYSDVVVEGNR